MIFESELEKEAFNILCDMANMQTCNPLDEDLLIRTKLKCSCEVTCWLKAQESKNLTFTDEELETYFRKQREAEEYINQCIRFKRADQASPLQNGHCANCTEHEELK